jgi:hypothetical protein
MALWNDHVDIARLLLERGANVEATDQRVSFVRIQKLSEYCLNVCVNVFSCELLNCAVLHFVFRMDTLLFT